MPDIIVLTDTDIIKRCFPNFSFRLKCVLCMLYKYFWKIIIICQFAVVFDAGSTHTSMLIYEWEGSKFRGTALAGQAADRCDALGEPFCGAVCLSPNTLYYCYVIYQCCSCSARCTNNTLKISNVLFII